MKIYKKSSSSEKKTSDTKKRHLLTHTAKMLFWFFLGATLGTFFLASFLFVFYQRTYSQRVYPGVFVNGIEFGGKSENDVATYFTQKNAALKTLSFTFTTKTSVATASAQELGIGYDTSLLADQAYAIGRSGNIFTDITILFQAYVNGIFLSPSYTIDDKKFSDSLAPLAQTISKPPQNALFTYENGRVTAFKTARNGQDINMLLLKKQVMDKAVAQIANPLPLTAPLVVTVPLKVTPPEITNEKANKLGIKELVGVGTSLYAGSIDNRIYNLSLAASRLNGILVKPGEVFSFVKAVGDISNLSGYKQAYVIENGKTVLGDGGGVCQVSTTLFRAILNAGLPVVERNPHAYRVHYYEEDLGPGIDAAIYSPSVDLKFKNDTEHYILIQAYTTPDEQKLTFELYGTKDNREVEISKPVILSQSPAPEPLYQDDPTLPKGQVKQVDFAASGANVYFTRTVKKNGETIISDKFYSNYRPWQAVFLRGTKEG